MTRTKKRLSAKAVRRLRKVQERILEEPRRVHMNIGIGRRGPHDEPVAPDGHAIYQDVPAWPPCHTVGCIAGHLCIAARRMPGSWPDQSKTAARLIGYDEYLTEEAPLFYERYWPRDLKTQIRGLLPGTPAYAKVVAVAIDAWIAGDGSFDVPA